MYRTIYVPADNSEHSNRAIDIAVALAERLGARVVGSHVYAARLHDYRFKQMEFTLPEEYLEENELERQRRIHDSLITMGLQLISDSYLDVLQKRCEAAGLPFERKMFDGKHYEVLARDITESRYDLVVLGALGMGAVRESVIGGVCERVVRRIGSDTLVVRNLAPLAEQLRGGVVAAVDGSARGYAGLLTALELGRRLSLRTDIVAVCEATADHPEAADYEALCRQVLEEAVAVAESALNGSSASASARLRPLMLHGKPFEQLLHYCRQEQPWLLILGRNGLGAEPTEMALGSCAENLLRLAPCNVFLSAGAYPSPTHAALAEGMVSRASGDSGR
ncbi:MAG: universal stress protein [Candidatus Tectomicrobia bacterium]|nr:universal stress protein [Candidatus Tectomicrobia bacterium]